MAGEKRRPRALVLGSFPGAQSLAQSRYYAHTRNKFWTLLYGALGAGAAPQGYRQRLRLLKTRSLALCDVLGNCARRGSLDSAIKNPVPNAEVSALLARLPRLPVFFTGRKAEQLFRRFFAPQCSGRALHCLPSPSPACMSITPAAKLKAWQSAFAGLRTAEAVAERAHKIR